MLHITTPNCMGIQMEHVVVTREANIGIIRMNKTEKLNAWDKAMRDSIMAALRTFDADDAIGAVILTGTGERAFCAGQDFAEAHGFDEDGAEEWNRGVHFKSPHRLRPMRHSQQTPWQSTHLPEIQAFGNTCGDSPAWNHTMNEYRS